MMLDVTLCAVVAIVFLLLAPLLLSLVAATLMIPVIIIGALNDGLKWVVGYLRRWRSGGRIRP